MTHRSIPPHNSATEQYSPDGQWHVVYERVDGDKAPLVCSPRLMHAATGRIVFDLWGSSLDGSIRPFTSEGCHLTVRDPYGPTILEVSVDLRLETFVILAAAPTARPLSQLFGELRARIDRARFEALASLPPPLPPPKSGLVTRLKALWKG